MIEAQYQRAIQILTENKDKLILLAEKLLEKEVIFKDNLVEIFGNRAWDNEIVTDILHDKIEANIQLEKDQVNAEKDSDITPSDDVENTSENEDESTNESEDGR